jgi:phospholipid/cholesterol/gamma-HCH transport system substrate-binding protein
VTIGGAPTGPTTLPIDQHLALPPASPPPLLTATPATAPTTTTAPPAAPAPPVPSGGLDGLLRTLLGGG